MNLKKFLTALGAVLALLALVAAAYFAVKRFLLKKADDEGDCCILDDAEEDACASCDECATCDGCDAPVAD